MLLVNIRTSIQIQIHLFSKAETSWLTLLIFIALLAHENNDMYLKNCYGICQDEVYEVYGRKVPGMS